MERVNSQEVKEDEEKPHQDCFNHPDSFLEVSDCNVKNGIQRTGELN